METTTIITGIVCYLLGLLIGVFASRSTYRAKVQEAEERGVALGKKEAQLAQEEATSDLTERMRAVRDNLLDTFDAYQGALRVIDEKFQPGAIDDLSLTYEGRSEPVSQEQIDFYPSFGKEESAQNKESSPQLEMPTKELESQGDVRATEEPRPSAVDASQEEDRTEEPTSPSMSQAA